jgi:hypothetical protein
VTNESKSNHLLCVFSNCHSRLLEIILEYFVEQCIKSWRYKSGVYGVTVSLDKDYIYVCGSCSLTSLSSALLLLSLVAHSLMRLQLW